MHKEDMIHIYNEIVLSHKKEQSNTDGPRDYHMSEVRQRQVLYDILYMWNIEYDTMNL